jgi:deoxyadenosine/deoxycytidine kinase
MNQFDFIAIEGVIGAGKTSLAKLLAKRHGAKLVLEEFEENPFLPKFYEDMDRYAFQTQLSFLASRFHQQQKIQNKELFHELVLTDYLFDKDRIFARVNLAGDEMALYDKIFSIMNLKTPKPDLVVFIQCTVERLLYNIEMRNREYEQNIDPVYLQELNDVYNQFFHHYDRSPLMIINASEIDFVNDKDHLDYIDQQIFYSPIRNTHTHITPG